MSPGAQNMKTDPDADGAFENESGSAKPEKTEPDAENRFGSAKR
jgi:hypothetical protein